MSKFFSGDAPARQAGWSERNAEQDADEFDVALNYAEKIAVKAAMRGAGVEQNVRSTLRNLAGDGFSPAELERLQERVLDRATMDDVKALWGIEAGAPVVISPNQKAIVDGLFKRLGGDPLAERARSSYERTLRDGRVRAR